MSNNKTKTMNEHPAFEFIRLHKQCSEQTERLVLERNGLRLSPPDMMLAFKNGVAGQYGKFIHADAQTLLAWCEQYAKEKSAPKNYLQRALIPVGVKVGDVGYPESVREWRMEVNKCYRASLGGVSDVFFHPHCYDRMMLDNLITPNAYLEFTEVDFNKCDPYSEEVIAEVTQAKQKALHKIFKRVERDGWPHVYQIAM